MNPFKTKQFRELFNKWNDKLKASGFVDIENMYMAEPTLKTFERMKYAGITNEVIAHRRAYFQKAEQLLESYTFMTPDHKRVWELYVQGLSTREIASKLRSKRLGRQTVHRIITHISRELV